MDYHNVYTLGYRQKDALDLLQRATESGAIILDIRYKPYSRWNPRYNKEAMIKRYGDYGATKHSLVEFLLTPEIKVGQYYHLEELGNTSYLSTISGHVTFKNLEAGIQEVLEFLMSYDVVLLCSCRYFGSCHRVKVTNELLKRVPDLKIVHFDETFDKVQSAWDNDEIVHTIMKKE